MTSTGRARLIVPDVPGLGESTPLPNINLQAFTAWLRALLDQVDAGRPTLVAHSLVGTLAARFAVRHGSLLSRLVIYASPGVVRYRMPLGLRYRALRFAVRPTASNFERFQRFALLDRDATRGRDPVWFDAFSDYTVARAQVREVKATMGRLVTTQTKQIPRDELAQIVKHPGFHADLVSVVLGLGFCWWRRPRRCMSLLVLYKCTRR